MARLRWLAVALLAACSSSSSTPPEPPTLTGVCPKPVQAPSVQGLTLTGTFTLVGSNLAGATVITDGPLVLDGAARPSADGGAVEQDYLVGCCAPQEGQVFHLTVTTEGGEATIATSITLGVPPACTP